MTSDLPQEIIDAILQELRTDLTALRQCLLVSSSFRFASRRHLFAHVTLRSLEKCKIYLTHHADTVCLVRKLRIIDSGWAKSEGAFAFSAALLLFADSGVLDTFNFDYREEGSEETKIAEDTALSRLLSIFDVLEWRANQLMSILQPERGKILFPRSRAISSLLGSERLSTIIIDGAPLCAFPLEILAGVPALRHLAFTAPCVGRICHMLSLSMKLPEEFTQLEASSYTLRQAVAARTVEGSNRLRYQQDPSKFEPASYLHSLDARGSHLDHLVDYLWPQLKTLRRLRIAATTDCEPPLLWELLEFCFDSLVSFRWDDVSKAYSPDTLEDPPTRSFAAHLRLFVYELRSIHSADTAFRLLETTPLPPTLEYLAVVTRAFNPNGSASDHDVMHADRHLSRIATSYPCLRHIYLALVVLPGERAPAYRWIEGWFHVTRQSGIFELLIGSREEVEEVLEDLDRIVCQ
ncbi:hypothetical protein H0H81_002066 [Sphagnurus paluster]|uniref:F-box domain-containing protein n=1 Tax=Sphagnurus paluster TaxID=117069 RepID=A0A9P7GGV0_9AGAR|nr:hypothetical protein H0H81_002066 [Sphagnurus paluster]